MPRLTGYCPLVLLLGLVLLMAGCGDSSSTSGSTAVNAPAGDFSIAASPPLVTLSQGASATLTITVQAVNGWTSPVSVSLSGLPSSVQANPSTLTVSPGASQTITLTASATASLNTATITVTGAAASVSHTATFQLQLVAASFQTRLRYFDNVQDLPADLNFDSLPHALYNPATKRFFFADSGQNRILVYDATTEKQVGVITVPGAWAIDQSPDQQTLYAGTEVGAIYVIDPVGMTVTETIPANDIGPNGYAAYVVRPLANGTFALLGDQGGIPAVDGYGSFSIWNRTNNSLTTYVTPYSSTWARSGTVACAPLEDFANLQVTPDRTLMFLENVEGAAVCRFDPSTGQSSTATLPGGLYAGAADVFQTPDGKNFLTAADGNVYVFDSTTLQMTDQFSLETAGAVGWRPILSFDGNTLYAVTGAAVLAYNWRTHALLGWASSPSVTLGFISSLSPLAVDGTGLIAGLMGNGVGFADLAGLSSGTPQNYVSADVLPSLGPTSGGTTVQFSGAPAGATAQNIYFGAVAGTNLTQSSSHFAVTSPANGAGVVDVTMQTTAGAVLSAFAGFSYGPTVTKINTQISTAEGGATETVFGYGFGPAYSPTSAGVPSDLKVSVGGQAVQLTNYSSAFAYSGGIYIGTPLTPLQMMQFALPPGSAASSADLVITNSAGTTTVKNAISYVSAVQQYPLPGAQLFQGIYDQKRDLYYFTDQNQVRVFSRASGWVNSIVIPRPRTATAQRLIGISISPNGSEVAVSDAAADVIYVYNPDNPSAIRTFALPNTFQNAGTEPCGLAISDTGIVYYASFDAVGYDAPSFFKLDTSTGSVTPYPGFGSLNGPGDIYTRVIITADNQRVFYVVKGAPVYVVLTATDSVQQEKLLLAADSELTLSGNQASLAGGEGLFDVNLNLKADLAYNGLAEYDANGVYGEKLSPDGSVLLSPVQDGIQLFDGNTGILVNRIGLPVTLTNNYDALVADGRDNTYLGIIGASGNGVAVIDLSSVAPLSAQFLNLTAENTRAPLSKLLVDAVAPLATGTESSNLRPPTRRLIGAGNLTSLASRGVPQTAQGNQMSNGQSEAPASQAGLVTTDLALALTNKGGRAPQSISLVSPGPAQVGESIPLSASSDSGLPVHFLSKTQGVCIVTGNVASLVRSGTCTVEAVQDGNSDYLAAQPVTQTFAVNGKSQKISFAQLPGTATLGEAGMYNLAATTSSGLISSFSVAGPATINGSTLTITGAGTVVVTASQSGNEYYAAADPVSQTIVVTAGQKGAPY